MRISDWSSDVCSSDLLFSTHIVSDLERVASHVAFMHQGRLLLHSELDSLKERHLRLHVPPSAADQLVGPVPGEVARRPHPYGGPGAVIVREEGAAWPARPEEHTSELQSLMLTAYAVFC